VVYAAAFYKKLTLNTST